MPDDDIKLHTYQDDLTTDDNATDPLMDEENDNPADELGIPEDEYADELDKEIDDEDIVDHYGRNRNDIDVLEDEESRTEDLFDEDDPDA